MPTFSKNQFLSFALSFIDSNSESLTELMGKAIGSFSILEVKKNDYFVKENEVCRYFCYVESGILQHAIMVEGEEKTSYLALKNSVTSSLYSFLFEQPSRKFIKALVDTQLYVIDLKKFKELIATNDAFHHFYYHLIEKQICLIDDYRIDLLTLTPEERYRKLLVNEPKLLQEVPLHYLASFLGISNRHMSRIRRNTL